MVNSDKNSEFALAVANLAAAAMAANPGMAMDVAVRNARELLKTHVVASQQQIRDSVRNDKIQCLEDGTWHVMLRRYLMRKYAMTPEQYRRKWGLPDDYPMVAPAYASRRSKIAKKSGLGKRG
ncbi:MAG: MucR family transcriptional regulator [Muribaculaceae bacterium]|nr:MucR family transcriptional regulator [Muribaculaceae bacterium]